VLVLGVGLGSCGDRPRDAEDLAEDAENQDFRGDLVFENVTLNRSDNDGNVLWEIRAKEVRYSRDRQYGRLIEPRGKLYNNQQELAYEVSGRLGEIERNGDELKLRGDVRATDRQNKLLLKGAQADWFPKQDRLTVEGNPSDLNSMVEVEHPDVKITARQGTAFSDDRRIILRGEVDALSKDKQFSLQSERLVWQPAQDLLEAQGKVNGRHLKEKLQLQAERLVWRRKEQEVQAIGKAIATGQDEGIRLNADRLLWEMKPQIVQAIGQVRGEGRDPQVRLSADRAIWDRKRQEAQALGNAIVTSREPALQVQSDRLVWQMQAKWVQSDRPTQVNRFLCAAGTCRVSDRAKGQRMDVNLQDRVAFLRDNAQISLGESGVDLTGNSLIWDLKNDLLSADQPVTVFERQQQVVVRGNQGSFSIKDKVANLLGNVVGQSQVRPARLRTDRLYWAMNDQQLQAVGNVFYQQGDPPLTSTGDRAVGSLKDQQIVLLGGPFRRASSTFIPETASSAVTPSPSPSPGDPNNPNNPNAGPPTGDPNRPPPAIGPSLPGSLPGIPLDFPRTISSTPPASFPDPFLPPLWPMR
jgi:LPS export ABC transporter protein LptC